MVNISRKEFNCWFLILILLLMLALRYTSPRFSNQRRHILLLLRFDSIRCKTKYIDSMLKYLQLENFHVIKKNLFDRQILKINPNPINGNDTLFQILCKSWQIRETFLFKTGKCERAREKLVFVWNYWLCSYVSCLYECVCVCERHRPSSVRPGNTLEQQEQQLQQKQQ